jgi:hypothetical protein
LRGPRSGSPNARKPGCAVCRAHLSFCTPVSNNFPSISQVTYYEELKNQSVTGGDSVVASELHWLERQLKACFRGKAALPVESVQKLRCAPVCPMSFFLLPFAFFLL